MIGVRAVAGVCCAALAIAAANSLAAEAGATFRIEVTLQRAAGSANLILIPGAPAGNTASSGQGCTSRSDGDAAMALIQVFCAAGSFVTIAPAPGQAFAWQAAEAYRYDVGANGRPTATMGAAGGFDLRQVEGTVTALQVSDVTGNGYALEMLVSF